TVRLSSLGRPTWEWEPESGTWLRSEGTTPATDASGSRLSAKNVVVVEVPTFDSGYDAQGGEPVPGLELEGRGPALLASGGRTLEVEWTKESTTDPLLLETEDGAAAELVPGSTWVELMPADGGSYQVGRAPTR
ncbi:DUF3048 C-terminal domain-containing protein, partial [Georgenia sp. 10Sc9-8]|nr:DUF3048 C-terminal domain-containing protein [Georgenia halotolerans]